MIRGFFSENDGGSTLRDDNLQKIIKLRHELHRNPERSMREKETANTLMQFLRENTGFTIVQRTGWFYAVKQGTMEKEQNQGAEEPKGVKRIAFRAEMDALPIQEANDLSYASCRDGVSHKCGHDGHCAALCGLALELDQEEIKNTVYLIFQSGEETGQGAEICRDIISEEQISEIYAFHNLPGYPQGSIVYREGMTQPASEGLHLILRGQTSHASAPEEGRNPAQAIAQIVLYAQMLVNSRQAGQQQLFEQKGEQKEDEEILLCTVTGMQLGNGDFGISPGEGELYLTLRAEAEETLDQFEKEILRYAEDLAVRGGFEMESSIHDRFPETRNHDRCLIRLIAASRKRGLSLVRMEKLWRASEDFGHYLKECPGAMFYIGCGEDHPALHTAEYDFDDEILVTAVDIFATLAKS